MNKTRFLLLVLLLLFPFSIHSKTVGGDEENPFTLWYDDTPIGVDAGGSYSFPFIFTIPQGSYLYQDSIEVSLTDLGPLQAKPLLKPQSALKEDPFRGGKVPVYYNEARVDLPLSFPSSMDDLQSIHGIIQFQGCSHELCYRLMKIPFKATFRPKGKTLPTSQIVSASKSENFLSLLGENDFSHVLSRGFLTALLMAFVGGILTDLTPCVWPMIPVTLALIGVRKKKSAWHNLVAVSVMVLGLSLTYAALGVGAALLGKTLGFFFQSTFFLVFLVAVLVLMGLSLLGFFEIQLPPRLQTKLSRLSSEGYKGIFLVGLTMGFLAAPCVGPVIGPLLVYVAKTQDVMKGLVLMLSYALGMGLIFIVLGGMYGLVTVKLHGGEWLNRLKKGLGILMLVVAFYYGQSLYSQIAGPSLPSDGLWYTSLNPALKQAHQENKPMVIDFYAQWCPPCKELDNKAWSRDSVQKELADHFIAVKIDCTENTDECTQAIKKYNVIGWPTVVFLNEKQEEFVGERLIGKVLDEGQMLEILKRLGGTHAP